jgi:hypothetical protein
MSERYCKCGRDYVACTACGCQYCPDFWRACPRCHPEGERHHSWEDHIARQSPSQAHFVGRLLALSDAYELCHDLEELAERAENLAGNPHLRMPDHPLATVWLGRVGQRLTKLARHLEGSLPPPATVKPAAVEDT